MLRPAFILTLALPALVAQEASLETLQEQGRWKQVRTRVEGWMRAKPEDPYAQLWMSKVKQAFGDPEGALELARKAAQARPSDPEFQAQVGMAAGQAASVAEGKLRQFSLAREMKKALETALASKPELKEPSEYLLQFYLMAPSIIGGGEGKAKELAGRFTALRPAEGLLMQAEIAFHAKQPETAKGLIQQVLARDGKSYEAHLYMANYHLNLKPQALDAALASYRQALAANAQGIQAYAQIAGILAEQGKWAELEATLAQARKAVPDNLWPYYSAGRNLIVENKSLDHAEGLLRAYLAQEPEGTAPDLAATHWRLAQLYEKQGRRAEAVKALETALGLRPRFPQARKDLERLAKG